MESSEPEEHNLAALTLAVPVHFAATLHRSLTGWAGFSPTKGYPKHGGARQKGEGPIWRARRL